jgi:uncharacterized RDD family membrane protein YckC
VSTVWPASPAVTRQALQGRPAGLVSRLAAAAIDLLVLLAGGAALYGAVAGLAFLLNPRSFSWPTGFGWSVPAVAALVGTPYLAISWSASGRTLGDVLFGLRIGGRDGRLLGPGRSVVRALLCLAFPIGLVWVPFDRRRRSLQDVLFRTSVRYDWLPSVRT